MAFGIAPKDAHKDLAQCKSLAMMLPYSTIVDVFGLS
jgi:hypothetical protein